MQQILIKIVRWSGIPLILRHIFQRNRVTILAFHNPTPKTFATAIQYFKKHYNIISLKDFVFSDITKYYKNNLILTFDDGYKDNYQLLETIKTHQVPVTIFLCSDLINSTKHFWWTLIPDGIKKADLKQMSNKKRLETFSKFGVNLLKQFDHEPRQVLNFQEIKEMKMTNLIDFQSHTKSHPILVNCSANESYKEIYESKILLEELLNVEIFAIAFPSGDYSSREIKFVRESGYRCSLTIKPGYNSFNSANFELKRFGISNTAKLEEIVVKASGAWGFLQYIFWKVRDTFHLMTLKN